MEHLEVFQNVVVDVIVPRRILVNVGADVVGIGNAQAREGDVTLVPDRDRGLAVAMHLHVPFLIHSRHTLISALILRPARDVLAVAVGEKGRDNELLLSFGLKRSLAAASLRYSVTPGSESCGLGMPSAIQPEMT